MFVRFGMAADEVFKAGARVRRRRWSGNDAAEVCAVGEDSCEAVQHAVGGFAYSEHAEIGKVTEVVGSIGAAESEARYGEAAFDSGAGIDGFEGAKEDSAG